MKVVITGGAGFIGRNLVRHLQGKAWIHVVDNLRSGFRRNLDGLDCTLVQGSILDRPLVRKIMQGVDYVFHLAALVSVPESVEKPDECAEINTAGTLLVLEEAQRAGAKKLVFSSSAAIYGDNPMVPKLESMAPEPKSPYASTKLEGEQHCEVFSRDGLLATACLRYFNVFGPHQDPTSQYAAAIPAFIESALAEKPIMVFGDGSQTRDFVFSDDVVAANAFFAMESSATGVFNIARGSAITIDELAKTIRQLTNSSAAIEYSAPRPGDVKHSVASVAKAAEAGFTARSDFRAGLQTTIDFFRKSAQTAANGCSKTP